MPKRRRSRGCKECRVARGVVEKRIWDHGWFDREGAIEHLRKCLKGPRNLMAYLSEAALKAVGRERPTYHRSSRW